MSRERLGTHSQGATSRLVFLFYEYTKNDKRTGSNDCVQASLTQSESMLMALCSLHSIGNAPGGIHRIAHPSTSITRQKAPEKQFTPCEFLRKVRSCAHATTTSSRSERRDGMAWECKSGQKRSQGEVVYLPATKLQRPSYSTDCVTSDTTAQTSCLIHVPSLPLCTMVSFSSTFKGECAHPRCACCLCSSSPCTCSVQLVKRSSKSIVVDSCVA